MIARDLIQGAKYMKALKEKVGPRQMRIRLLLIITWVLIAFATIELVFNANEPFNPKWLMVIVVITLSAYLVLIASDKISRRNQEN
jgi:polyferredoxin